MSSFWPKESEREGESGTGRKLMRHLPLGA